MKKCPYCAEEIQDAAIVCRYCGRELNKPIPQTQPTMQPTAGPIKAPRKSFLGQLVAAGSFVVILCFLCIVFNALQSIVSPQEEGKPTTTAGISSNVVIKTPTLERAVTAAPTQTTKPTNTSHPSPTPNIGMIGEAREARGIAVTVLDITNMVQMDFLTADQGYIFLVIDVTIENVGRNEVAPYNPFYFSVKDSDGYEYNATLFTREPSLKSGELPRGDKVRGFVAFEVRTTSKGLVLTYEPIVILGGYEPIRIALDKVLTVQADQEASVDGPCELCTFECPEKQGETEFCIADPGLVVDKNQFERIVKEYCRAKGGFCKLLIWNDLPYLPETLPMTELQINNQIADYTLNGTSGIDCLRLLAEGNVIYSSRGCK